MEGGGATDGLWEVAGREEGLGRINIKYIYNIYYLFGHVERMD